MSIEEQLKQYIIQKYGGLTKFAPHTKLPYSTIQSILRRGVTNCNGQNLQAICDALEINPTALIEGRIEPKAKVLFDADTKFYTDVDYYLSFLKDDNSDLSLDGVMLTFEEKKYVKDYMSIFVDLMRQKRLTSKADDQKKNEDKE